MFTFGLIDNAILLLCLVAGTEIQDYLPVPNGSAARQWEPPWVPWLATPSVTGLQASHRASTRP